VAYFPSKDLIVSGGNSNLVKIWDYKVGTLKKQFAGHTNAILVVAPQLGTDVIASVSKDTTIKVWNYNSGKLQSSIGLPSQFATSIS